ncbi:uncharacterized protein Fot_17287 [Forsythia ovata]|uniref:Uncharacterized protein n=1 Tax=Forsythia ovata TaxID=205694 RepID=A0ABD1VF84_9LAMI
MEVTRMKEGYDHRRTSNRRRRTWRPCMQNTRKISRWVWRPVVPSWEKEFCLKVGLFTWTKFLEAKKYAESTHYYKIFDWDDSAGKEAFHNAKSQFYAQINGLSCVNPLPNPNMYIDEIDWDAKVDPELDYSRSVSDTDEDEDDENKNVPDWYHIRLEDIKPTGWDIDIQEEFSSPKVLIGLIVGGD